MLKRADCFWWLFIDKESRVCLTLLIPSLYGIERIEQATFFAKNSYYGDQIIEIRNSG